MKGKYHCFLQNGWKHTTSDADAPGDAEPKEGGVGSD